jgi:hypothetical protein
MTTYTTIQNGDIDPDSPVTTTLLTLLRDNPIAMFEKASGAPVLSNNYIVQGMLNTSTGVVYTNSTTPTQFTLPGGSYGFYPQILCDAGGGLGSATIGGDNSNKRAWGATYATKIVLASNDAGNNAHAQQRYINACPPYNLGDGEIGQFIFAVVDENGRIKSSYAAPEAPWHNNGPTDIRADIYDEDGNGWRLEDVKETVWDANGNPQTLVIGRQRIEITQAIKQADMPLIPHPFIGNDLTGKTIVLLDPVSDLTWHLAEMHEQGESPNGLLHDGYLRVDNTALNRAGPPGVMVVGAKWRNTQ